MYKDKNLTIHIHDSFRGPSDIYIYTYGYLLSIIIMLHCLSYCIFPEMVYIVTQYSVNVYICDKIVSEI